MVLLRVLGLFGWGCEGPSNVPFSIFITILNLYKMSEIDFLMLIWQWNMHRSQKIGILALESKYPDHICLLDGMAEWNETAQ